MKQQGVLVATDAIQDPGNMGTIIRTAAWFGVCGLLAGKGSTDIFNPKTVRSTAGATGAVPYQNAKLAEMLPAFEEAGWEVFMLEASEDSTSIGNVVHAERVIIIVGNEANGIDSNLMIPGRTAVHIKPRNDEQNVESLNAAIALAIALYEFS